MPGSSPRVRGKPARADSTADNDRLIPACAGKTPKPKNSSGLKPAHPRVCGENRYRGGAGLGMVGSSPRVRGKQVRADPRVNREGLIPACAGKTARRRTNRNRAQAHPRVCGENVFTKSHAEDQRGSSPRVRGKPSIRLTSSFTRGLIPACAGKTPAWTAHPRHCRAHPRVCGENRKRFTVKQVFTGSSPRVRGKRFGGESITFMGRLIPACAGKTNK